MPVPTRLSWTPELVDRFWEGVSQTALVRFAFARQAGPSLTVMIDHLLPREGDILDFGAGEGDLVRLLCDRGFRAAAFERPGTRAAALQESLGQRPGFLGVIGEDSHRQFDLVVMAEVIEHVLDEELDSVLKRVAALTRTGGLLVVTTPNDEDLELGMSYCPVSNVLFHRWQHVRSFNDASLSELFARAGFEALAVHRLSFDNALFLPFDGVSSAGSAVGVPDYLASIRRNESVAISHQSNLLYVGRKI